MGAMDNAAVQAELARLRADLEFERQRGERLMGLLETAQRSAYRSASSAILVVRGYLPGS